MLTQLSIHNFGLIDELDLEFTSGLNILTGETGAGKSIIIGALRSVLGERMGGHLLRDPQEPCRLEAVFDLTGSPLLQDPILSDFFEHDDPSLILHRAYTPDGRNKIKVNGANVTVSQLKAIGDRLIDFHGPHDHQMLLSPDTHIHLLDQMVRWDKDREQYRTDYEHFSRLRHELNDLQNMAATREREVDLLSHQVKELEQVSLDEEAYENVVQEKSRIDNAQRLSEHAQHLLSLLDGEEGGASELIRQSFQPMHKLNDLDAGTSGMMDYLEQMQNHQQELLLELRSYAEGLQFEPADASRIHDTSDMYEDIRKKYGPGFDEICAFYHDAKEKLERLTHLEANDAALRQRIGTLEISLTEQAQQIHQKRAHVAKTLKKDIEKELSELGMPHIRFEVQLEKGPLTAEGFDRVTFLISPNAGEELKPLSQIVSSGEAARVMLALKKALIQVDPIPVLIFDEIDAQIGGRLGKITGEKLRDISRVRQVLLITHLPQIASFADRHFKVLKKVREKRAVTEVECLDQKSQVQELAKMMAGEEISPIAVKHANDMLSQAKK